MSSNTHSYATPLFDSTAAGSSARRPLRVCHLAYSFYESDNRVRRYADALTARGDRVEVIALRRSGLPRTGRVGETRVTRLQRRTVSERAAVTYLLKILLFLVRSALVLAVRHIRQPYDIVHVHNVPDFLVFAAIVPKLLGARIVLDIHDVLPELFAGKFGASAGSSKFRVLVAVERLSCRFADQVIVANHIWEQRLVERSVPMEKCTTIMNYPDLRFFRPAEHGERRVDGKFIMLYPGSLNRHQGVDVAVRAFARVAAALPDAELHIYGEGPARSELAKLARESGIGDRVKLMAPLPIDKVSRVMARADLGVEPKRAEGFPNEALSTKILEFMACGVPVVASRTLVHAHYFDETILRFFPSGNDEVLASRMLEAHAIRAQQREQVKRARQFADRYSWQERVGDYVTVIESLVARRSQVVTVSE